MRRLVLHQPPQPFTGKCLCVLSMILLFGRSLHAQGNDSLVADKIAQLTGLWLQQISYTSYNPSQEDLPAGLSLFHTGNDSSGLNRSVWQARKDLYDENLRIIRGDKGLKASANYLENFGLNPASDDNLIYNRRLQAGVEWDLLGEGLLAQKYKAEILANDFRIDSLRALNKQSPESDLLTYNTIIYAFNVRKKDLLDRRKKLNDAKLKTAAELYYLKEIPYSRFLETLDRQVEIASQTRIYEGYNDQMRSLVDESALPRGIPPVFDIDAGKMFAKLGSTSLSDSIAALQVENMRIEEQFWTKARLQAGLRYNFYDMPAAQANRNFMSAQIGLSVPISFHQRDALRTAEAMQQISKAGAVSENSNAALVAANLLYEFRYKLKQYAVYEQKRKTYLELLRIEQVKQQFGDLEFNPLTALTLLDELMAIDVEMLDLRQQLYLKLLQISEQVPGPVNDYTKTWTPVYNASPQLPADRRIYIWSKSIQQHKPAFIAQYLKMQHIGTAIVSPGKDAHAAIALIDSLLQSGIRVEALIGDNDFIEADQQKKLDSLVKRTGDRKIDGVHLDVEPHTRADWESNKDKYLTAYIAMLKNTKAWCLKKGWKLSVSIPVFYPEDKLTEIYAVADEVYLMAYEHPDAAWIRRKTREELAAGNYKTVLALRTKDFTTRNDLENIASELARDPGFTALTLHDLESLLMLDGVAPASGDSIPKEDEKH